MPVELALDNSTWAAFAAAAAAAGRLVEDEVTDATDAEVLLWEGTQPVVRGWAAVVVAVPVSGAGGRWRGPGRPGVPP
jgi:hypothetical protein